MDPILPLFVKQMDISTSGCGKLDDDTDVLFVKIIVEENGNYN